MCVRKYRRYAAIIVSPRSNLLCGPGILLQRWCYADDVLFGATISGRNIPIDGIEETLGLFINTLPLRLRDDGATLLQHLQRMHQTLIAHYSNEHDALASIQRLVHKEGHAGDLLIP